jgi:tripartite-type tricarboxylate transporter receptor subunit TctC
VPYKGADAVRDLLAGRIQFMFATIPSVIAYIQSGALRALAVTSLQRSRSLPDVPTVADSGFPGFEAGSWFGFFAPKGTPVEVVSTLSRAVDEIVKQPSVDSQMVREGADPVGGSSEQFAQFVQREFEKWRAIVRESGATAE